MTSSCGCIEIVKGLSCLGENCDFVVCMYNESYTAIVKV